MDSAYFAEVVCNGQIDYHVMADAIPPSLPRMKNILLDERVHISKLRSVVSVNRHIALAENELSIAAAVWQQQSDSSSVVTISF
jgi:hypothetical protein